MAALRQPKVAQGRYAGIYGMQKPEIRNLARRIIPRQAAILPAACKRGAFLFQDLEKSSYKQHQALARIDLQARRNIVGVNPEMAPAISDNSGDRKPDHPVLLFGVEHQAYVFARHTNIAFIAPAIFVREGTGDGLVPNMVHRFFGEITVEAIGLL